MKNLKAFSMLTVLATLIFVMQGCSFSASTANLNSLKTSKDKEGKEETTSYKAGDTIFGRAIVANNPGKVKINLYLSDSKGTTLKGSEVSVNLDGDGFAEYSLPTPEDFTAGSYILTADMINEAGEKKDSKTATITVAE